jgi:hypothetical protein
MTPAEYDALLAELIAIRKRQNWLLFAVCGIIMWLGAVTFGSDLSIAAKDRQQFPQQEWPFIYYFGFSHLPRTQQAATEKALAFVVCSCNRATVIEQQLPTKIATTVYRIDLRNLGWEKSFPALIKQHYPYSPAAGSLVLLVKADWFIQAIDQTRTQGAYHELLFGTAPKTLDEFLGLLDVTKDAAAKRYDHGHIESQSGVSVTGTRLITTVPTAGRSDVWLTADSRVIAGDSDPLEKLDRTQKFDAQEIIGAIPKSVAATGVLGQLQVYALANAAGALQERAPVDIVVDHTNTRGAEIRSPLSCMVCHAPGLNPLKQNALRQYVASGAEAFADYKNQQEIERFFFANLQQLIDRHNEDYAAIIMAINGLTPSENAKGIQSVILQYDAPLTLEDTARELRVRPADLKLALGFVGRLPARIAMLPHGGIVNRETWELEYRRVKAAVDVWRKR